jgi:hypothetical protein
VEINARKKGAVIENDLHIPPLVVNNVSTYVLVVEA